MTESENSLSEDFINRNFFKIAINIGNWTTLYFSKEKNMYVKKYFPFSEMQGGGPARFMEVDEATAIKEFNIK